MKKKFFGTFKNTALIEQPIDIMQNASFADTLLCTSLDIGKQMLKSGGEIHRVEDTINRICHAYGAVHVEVFTITSLIVASVRMEDGSYSSQVRRIYSSSNNLAKLERLNQISREICENTPPLDEVRRRIYSAKSVRPHPMWVQFLGSALAAGGFAVFFGGNCSDGIAAALIGIILMFIDIIRPSEINAMSHAVIKSFLAGTLAFAISDLCSYLQIASGTDKIMIGTIMLMIPGLAVGNALRDLLCGDIIAGTLQLIQALLLAVMIAFGFAISMLLFGGAA